MGLQGIILKDRAIAVTRLIPLNRKQKCRMFPYLLVEAMILKTTQHLILITAKLYVKLRTCTSADLKALVKYVTVFVKLSVLRRITTLSII